MPSVTSRLSQLADALSPLSDHSWWFLFGSALDNSSRPNDVDILIVCDLPASAVDELAINVQNAHVVEPLHLVVFSVSEEAELDFIARNGATQFWPRQTTIKGVELRPHRRGGPDWAARQASS